VIAMHAYVRDVMTTGVVSLRPDTPYREIAAMFREHRVSGFPVTDGDGKVIGVVSESDLLTLATGATAGTVRPARPPRAT
jgi:CBS domain-containing protein